MVPVTDKLDTGAELATPKLPDLSSVSRLTPGWKTLRDPLELSISYSVKPNAWNLIPPPSASPLTKLIPVVLMVPPTPTPPVTTKAPVVVEDDDVVAAAIILPPKYEGVVPAVYTA